MVCFGVDLYRFSLICNDYFRKVVYKKEKGEIHYEKDKA